MTERRPLTEGLKPPPSAIAAQPINAAKEQEFVFGKSATTNATVIDRVSITTRIRGDFARALKRASLERQLQGVEPNTLQDFMDEALEPWLRKHGLLS